MSDRFSFPEGTLIWTEDGYKPIEEIAVGDLVWSRDENNPYGPNVLKPVTELFKRTTLDMSVLTVKVEEPAADLLLLSSAANDNDTSTASSTKEVRLTPEHPVYVMNRLGEELGWVMAGDLVSGDLIADIDGGQLIKIVNNTLTQTEETVYNFEVEEAHSYFADELGLWVHNPALTELGGGNLLNSSSLTPPKVGKFVTIPGPKPTGSIVGASTKCPTVRPSRRERRVDGTANLIDNIREFADDLADLANALGG